MAYRDKTRRVPLRYYASFPIPLSQFARPKSDAVESLIWDIYEDEGRTLVEFLPPAEWAGSWGVRELKWLSGRQRLRSRIGRLLRRIASRLDGFGPHVPKGRFVFQIADNAIELEVDVKNDREWEMLVVSGFTNDLLP